MNPHIAEIPARPLPQIPQSQQPRMQPPTVFVYERQQWEYRVITKHLADEPSLSEAELNAFGKDGWELAGAVPVQASVQFFFKRAKV